MDNIGFQGVAGRSGGAGRGELTEQQEKYLRDQLGDSWFESMAAYLGSHTFINILKKVQEKRKMSLVYPPHNLVFRAFRETPYNEVRAVVFGQDPYHDGSATGLAFGNDYNKPKITSPSLMRMIENLEKLDEKGLIPFYFRKWNLEHWCKQGVLLLNKSLTVEYRKAGSHYNIWEGFAEEVIKVLNKKQNPVVYLLWGNEAISLAKMVEIKKGHAVFTAEHPIAGVYVQPQRPWDDRNCFLLANEFLEKFNPPAISW